MSDKTNPDDLVYPGSKSKPSSSGFSRREHKYSGMTKRERFAESAMVGMLSDSHLNIDKNELVERAVRYADKLIEKLNE